MTCDGCEHKTAKSWGDGTVYYGCDLTPGLVTGSDSALESDWTAGCDKHSALTAGLVSLIPTFAIHAEEEAPKRVVKSRLAALEARRLALDILNRAEAGRDAVAKEEATQGTRYDGPD